MNLNNQTTLVTHPNSAYECQSRNIQVIKGFYLKVTSNSDFCYIVFDDDQTYNYWNNLLHNFLMENDPVTETLGCIYDLSINSTENKVCWDIKLTAIKDDISSITEYFVFDISQKNLYVSAKEVLVSVEDHLDTVNTLIFQEFLYEIIRLNLLSKTENDFITETEFQDFEFNYEKNLECKKHYKNLNAEVIEEKFESLEETELEDQVSNLLKLMEMQKLDLQYRLKELFSVCCNVQTIELLNNIEKNLEKVMKTKDLAFTTKHDRCLGRMSCECLIF